MTRERSMFERAAISVKKRGKATLEDILPDFPGCTRKQVHHALENARDKKLIRVYFRGRRHGDATIWEPGASAPSPLPEVKPLHPIPSVWRLANPIDASDWPPLPAGREFKPMGEWSPAEEELASNDSRKAA